MTKRCSRCESTLPLDAFGIDAKAPDGRNARCRRCRSELYAARDASRGTQREITAATPTEPHPCPRCGRAMRVEGAHEWCEECAPRRPPIPEQLEVVQEHRLKARVRQLEAQAKDLIEQLDDARAMSDLARDVALECAPGIQPRERAAGGKLREATALVLASDWHIEEQVRPEQVAGRNRYDLDISAQRMTRFFEAVKYGIEFNRQIFTVRDLCLWLGGDIITNYLHPDNVETNLLSPVQAIARAHQSIGDGIRYLLRDDKLERILIPCNDGNHGRLTEKMRAAARSENSIEWLLYTMLAREFAGEPRVKFAIADGPQLYVDIYGRTVRFTHGDTVNYQGGVGGITVPLLRALGRWDTVRRADLTCVGHFHQYMSLADLIVNGSLIGYSTYSMQIGARFEAPAQALTMLDPLRFKSISMPLWVSRREDDNNNLEGE